MITLDVLPPNLLSLIFRYLSPLDATCLALCSHDFMNPRSCNELLSKAFPVYYAESPEVEPQFVLLTGLARGLSQ